MRVVVALLCGAGNVRFDRAQYAQRAKKHRCGINSFKEDTLSSSEQTCIQSCAKRQSGAFAAMNDISQQLASKGGPGMF